MNLINAKLIFLITLILLIINSKAISSIITYKEILDNPTDLELNLNYAKQQEKSGEIKSTIATLERLSMLYPKNADATNSTTTATYIGTIERLEGSGTIVGKALE